MNETQKMSASIGYLLVSYGEVRVAMLPSALMPGQAAVLAGGVEPAMVILRISDDDEDFDWDGCTLTARVRLSDVASTVVQIDVADIFACWSPVTDDNTALGMVRAVTPPGWRKIQGTIDPVGVVDVDEEADTVPLDRGAIDAALAHFGARAVKGGAA